MSAVSPGQSTANKPATVPTSTTTWRRRPAALTAAGIAGVCVGLLGLALALAGSSSPRPGTAPLASHGPAAADPLYIGGAEIDDSAALRRNFGASTDEVLHVNHGDMNGDGYLDLVVGKRGQDAVYLNNGRSDFNAAGSEVPFGTTDPLDPDHFALGDLDGDGDLDAIGWKGGASSRDNALFLNDGSGRLDQRYSFPGGSSTVNDVAIADLNGDGALDAIVGREGEQNTIVLNNNSGTSPPSFAAERNLGPGNDGTRALATGDVDEDGDVDIVVANGGEVGQDNVSVVYLNDGSGGFFSGPASCIAASQWQWGVPTSGPGAAHSGTKLWATNLDGNYADNQNVSVISPAIDLSGAGGSAMELSWWQWLAFASGVQIDEFIVEVTRDGGATWQRVSSQGGSHAWARIAVALDSSYAVSGFRFRFRLLSDAMNNDEGFYVDDVAVTVGGATVYSDNFEANDGGFTTAAGFPGAAAHCIDEGDYDTTSVALGDMDGDGHLDIVLGNRARLSDPLNPLSTLVSGEERLYLNDGAGRFDDPSNQSAFGPSIDNTAQIAVGDIDGDGLLDVALAENGPCTGVFTDCGQDLVRYNNGSLGFPDVEEFGPDQSPTRAVALADLDDDGSLDVAVGIEGQQSRVYLSPGALAYLDDFTTVGGPIDMTEDLALGDIDLDGDLDLVVGNSPPLYTTTDPRSHLFLNDGTGAFPGGFFGAFNAPEAETRAVAVADLNGDGDLEVLLGVEGGQNRYLGPQFDAGGNLTGFANTCPTTCFGPGNDTTRALATGDVDRDGDLDIVVGNDGANSVQLNDGTGGFQAAGSSHTFGDGDTTSLALGDLNGDGFLDVVLGNRNGASVAYLNDGAGHFDGADAARPVAAAQDTRALALGDLNGDGALDVVLANHRQQNAVYLGDGTGGFAEADDAIPFGSGDDATLDVALGDLNGDGALDIVAAAGGETTRFTTAGSNGVEDNFVYLNDGAEPPSFVRQHDLGRPDGLTTSLALGDLNGDGTLDIVAGNQPQRFDDGKNPPNPFRLHRKEVFLNQQRRSERLPDELPAVAIGRPGVTANGQGFSSAQILSSTQIQVPITLTHPASVPVGRLELSYSTDGGGAWHAAVATTTGGQPLTNLATSPTGTVRTVVWDTFASGLFGQTDELVLRVQAFEQPPVGAVGTYGYANRSAGPRQWPYADATTYPFRVRGTQVRVTRETAAGAPAPEALVYRLPAGQADGGLPFSTAGGTPLRTDADGFLRGSGTFGVGDRLFALFPFTEAEHYTLYHTSAPVTETGLDGLEVTSPGVQTLVVKAQQPLMLFNLDISLEWDARYDDAFMIQLRSDIRRASEVLFDVTNGQVALGPVRIYQAKENWLGADVLIYAANNLRPAAAMGGVVDDLLDDQLKNGNPIEDAYVPGQVQMGPAWGRFGAPENDLGDDWPRALAHELGHYFLFQFDNYLGVVGGRLVPNDCVGSYMTDTYADEYSELLDRNRWTGACLDTLAEYTTGRTDWETVLHFYPWLNTTNLDQPGPTSQTLVFTAIEELDPGVAVTALDAPFFSLREGGNRLFIGSGGGQGYVFKNQDTPTLTDDYLIAVGAPIGDQMHARGAAPGDRLCVFDRQRSPMRIGCTTVGTIEGALQMNPVPGWQPQVRVSPVATDTLAITVTQSTGGSLMAQVLPTTGFSTTFPITSTVAALLPVPGQPDTYANNVKLDYPVMQAYVRIWEAGTTPPREAISQYVLGEGWGPSRRVWGPSRRVWGPSRRVWGPSRRVWGAPVSSGDGQVSVYNLADVFGDTGTSALQSLATLPSIPAWLRAVGNVQRFESADAVDRTMAFSYMQQDVPGGNVYEDNLSVYYSPNEGATWQALDTILDTQDNLATAVMPSTNAGDGLYMLAITIPMPALEPGWNQLAYPVAGERPVAEALASIADDYRLVYDNGPTASAPWRLYDQEVLTAHPEFTDLLNDLDVLEFGGVYWIYALRPTQPSLGLPSLAGDADPALSPLAGPDEAEELPPTTFYGWVTPSPGFTPAPGMGVDAWIDGVACGQATVQAWAGSLAYKVQVAAARPNLPTCGRDGTTVTFSVGGQTMVESATWDNTRAHFLPLEQLATGADLAVEQVVLPNPPRVGRPYAYLVTVRNLGPLPATEVLLHDTLPAKAQLLFAADEQSYCLAPAGQVRCALGAIPAFGSRTVIISVQLADPGLATNTVSVSAFEPDPQPGNNSSQETHDITTQAPEYPTAATLADFVAVARPDGRHEITWSTVSEINVLGFLIRRAPQPEGPYQRITPAVLQSRGGSSGGAHYRYVVPGTGPAFYRLEALATVGASEIFGPFPLRPASSRAYFPFMWQQ